LFTTNHYLHGHGDGHHDDIPEGYHKMEDGTLMKNADSHQTTELKGKAEVADPHKTAVTLDPNARVVEVRGVNYSYDVSEIKVKKGETITINFESTDGFHDFVIDELAVATKKVQPGTKTSVTFTADKVGSFEYYCSVGSHRAQGMSGVLTVEE
jgi:plastocyanin